MSVEQDTAAAVPALSPKQQQRLQAALGSLARETVELMQAVEELRSSWEPVL